MSVETPFPVTGTVTTESEDVTGFDFPCALVWLGEHESGDITHQIKNDLRVNHGIGVEARVTVYGSGAYDIESVEAAEDENE